MAIAPQNLMSDLRSMPDAALQKYAAMHKNDPFIFPLAFQESQDRQRARAAQQAQMAGQQQPKVVDQDLQQMMPPAPQPMMPPQQMAQAPQGGQPQPQQLPEESGIGQLPAPNLQGMAGGGIVAFGGGGEIPGYADEGLVKSVNSRAPSAGAGMDPLYAIPEMEKSALRENALRKAKEGRPLSSVEKALLFAAAPFAAAADVAISPLTGLQNLVRNPLDRSAAPSMTPVSDARSRALYGDKAAVEAPSTPPNNSPVAYDATTATRAADYRVADKPLAGVVEQPQVNPMLREKAPIAPAQATTGASGYEKKFLDAIGKDEVSKADRMKEATDIDKPLLEKMATAVEDSKNKLKTEGEQNFYMSLIQGGLAAAGASGPNALQNIAQGFEKGAAHYGEGLKDLRKAAQENAKMELAMSQYEASGKKEALKSYYDHQDKQKALTAAGLGQIYGHQISKEGQIAAAGVNANAQRNLLVDLGNAAPGSALRTGFDLQTAKAHNASLQEQWSKQAYPTGNMGEPNAAFLRRYPDPQTYIKEGMAAMNMVGGNSGNKGIIDIPNGAPSTTVRAR